MFAANAFDQTTVPHHLANSDLIIEAVFENMAVKQNIFRRLAAIVKPGESPRQTIADSA